MKKILALAALIAMTSNASYAGVIIVIPFPGSLPIYIPCDDHHDEGCTSTKNLPLVVEE